MFGAEGRRIVSHSTTHKNGESRGPKSTKKPLGAPVGEEFVGGRRNLEDD